MSIRPVDFNGMMQRTQDVSTIKQNQDNRPVVEQQTIQAEQVKQEQQLSQKVIKAKEKENDAYRYDAKEKGNGSYEQSGDKKQKKKQKNEDKVMIKGQTHGFDIKI